ncbi:putative Aldo keto reductase family [Trypanosoma vivax]|uniref:Aldo-keto reductase, putative n=1 Tax=Trypanosoma vivax (strain Y486) TaxID=1055687 RepID=F9WKX7_TRYVY|nr:putative aldo-keto reductase [Trypanosoma vivax]KAH8615930.1 putative Aldo keto reductase family [Trypanosoma vivax]CCD18160.1 aldo-keto reductase, putative [Trypanosoma vivax Y486]|eukprot:CCD18160.1 aldo-keto reductase, putative [Trypanosoma vivax Y486]
MPGANVMSFRPISGPVLGVTHKLPMRNGHHIPQCGFGTYRMAPSDAEAAVEYAVKCGFRHIDCAKAYCNQKAVGDALYRLTTSGVLRREDLFVTSKLWPTDQHPDHVEMACRQSLCELRLSYLDLYLIHWPVVWRHSPEFNTDEDKYPKDSNGLPAVVSDVKLIDTWRALCMLVDKGLVRSVGLSNCSEKHINEVMSDGSLYAPVINQIELHPALVQRDLLNVHRANKILTGAYSPLGMPSRFTPPGYNGLLSHEVLQPLAEHSGFDVARLLLNWSLDMHNVVIVRSTNMDHIKSNAKASLYALSDPVRMILDRFQEREGTVRTINPIDFIRDRVGFFS